MACEWSPFWLVTEGTSKETKTAVLHKLYERNGIPVEPTAQPKAQPSASQVCTQMLTDAHRRSQTLTDAHRRSQTLTDAHRLTVVKTNEFSACSDSIKQFRIDRTFQRAQAQEVAHAFALCACARVRVCVSSRVNAESFAERRTMIRRWAALCCSSSRTISSIAQDSRAHSMCKILHSFKTRFEEKNSKQITLSFSASFSASFR